jgi:5-methylcytosine-specific restriction endonuclease McrA
LELTLLTVDSSAILFVVAAVVVLLLVSLVLRRRSAPPFDRDEIMQQTRQVAEEAAREAAARAEQSAVFAYQQQQEKERQDQAAKRKEAASKAQQTRAMRIEALQQWRGPFVQFVQLLAAPFFAEWHLSDSVLKDWAQDRADVYIRRKPYVLEIVQDIHADAQRAAESYANNTQKSGREIARERAKSSSRKPDRNRDCPYCGVTLDDKAHLEHIVPVNRGGPSEPWNMVFVCVACNRAKRDLSLMEFAETDYARKRALRLALMIERLKALDKYADVWR